MHNIDERNVLMENVNSFHHRKYIEKSTFEAEKSLQASRFLKYSLFVRYFCASGKVIA